MKPWGMTMRLTCSDGTLNDICSRTGRYIILFILFGSTLLWSVREQIKSLVVTSTNGYTEEFLQDPNRRRVDTAYRPDIRPKTFKQMATS